MTGSSTRHRAEETSFKRLFLRAQEFVDETAVSPHSFARKPVLEPSGVLNVTAPVADKKTPFTSVMSFNTRRQKRSMRPKIRCSEKSNCFPLGMVSSLSFVIR